MRQTFASVGNLLRGNERGQLVLFVAGGMIVVIGFAALVVDLGLQSHTRRGVQNDADAIALAAVRELPDETSADAVALDWATKNGVASAEIQEIVYGETCSGDSIVGTATVRLQRDQRTFFASVLGIGNANINVCATARTGWAQGGPGLMPFGFHFDDPNVPSSPPICYYDGNPTLWDVECTLKIPKPNDTWSPGNTGPVRMDEGQPNGASNWAGDCNPGSSGASEYTENIVDGSECGYAPGDELRTKTGSMNNITCDAIDDKIDGNMDPIETVFSGEVGGVYTVVDQSHPRYVILPVVTTPPGSSGTSTPVTVETFITAYLVGCSNGPQNSAVVTVIPVQSDVYVAGIDFVNPGDPAYDTEWPLNTIKLVE